MLLASLSYGQATDLFFSMYAEGSSNNKFVEIYNGTNANIDLSNYMLKGSNNGGDWKGARDLTLTGTLEAGKVYVISTDAAAQEILNKADLKLSYESPLHYNGDDAIGLFKKNNSGTFELIDVIGVPTEDPGSGWNVAGVSNATANHTMTRKLTVCSPNSNWANSAGTDAASSEWLVTDIDSGWNNLGSFAGCSTVPSLSIDSPTQDQTIDFTTTATVKFTVTNFNVAANGAGDGYIKWKLDGVAQADKTDTSDITFTSVAGGSYEVYIELVDNNGNPVMPVVNATVNFKVNQPCDLVLADISATCDALTTGADTFNGSIEFTGGNTNVQYTITASAGTIGGDNPSTATSGKITVTGIPEGTDVTVTIKGDNNSSCDFTRTLFSPACIPFPIIETFDYTADTNLTDAVNWQTTSTSKDKVQVVSGTLANPFQATDFPNPTGNMVTFAGGGADPFIEFNQQNSGKIYTSFLFTPSDVSELTNANGGYFAVLTEAGGSYKSRLWLRQDTADNTKFNIGVSTGSSGATYHSNSYTPGEEVFVVVGFDFVTNECKVWIDPDPSLFAGTILPNESIKVVASGNDIPRNLGRFLLRQDSSTETPTINFDELRIGQTWAQVTPKSSTASVTRNEIDGFAVYPNPVNGNSFSLSTNSTDEKLVQVYNVLGKLVVSEKVSGQNSTINISTLTNGIYILKVEENGKIATKKLVVR